MIKTGTEGPRERGTKRPRDRVNEANKSAQLAELAGFARCGARAHEDERALRKRRVDEKRGAGKREAEVDVVEE